MSQVTRSKRERAVRVLGRVWGAGFVALALVTVPLLTPGPMRGQAQTQGREPRFRIFQFGVGKKMLRPVFEGVERRAKDCTPGNAVSVAVSIGFGGAGNTITGEARCDDAVVAGPVMAADPGAGGFAVAAPVWGVQVIGTASCPGTYGPVGPPVSSWVVTCTFF